MDICCQCKDVKFTTDKTDGKWDKQQNCDTSPSLVCTFSKAGIWVLKVSCSPFILTKAPSCCFSRLSLSCSSFSNRCWLCRSACLDEWGRQNLHRYNFNCSYIQLCVDRHHLLEDICECRRWGTAQAGILAWSLKPSLSQGFWGPRAAVQTR